MATIITRSGKGEPLTNDEVDANFDNLNADKVELSQDNTWTGPNAFTAGLESEGAGANSFRAGTNAGATSQGIDSVAIGFNSGASGQITSAVSVGRYSGNTDQEVNAVAIGNASGRLGQKSSAVGIGAQTGEHGQGIGSVSIGNSAGQYNQGDAAISIGNSAGRGTNAAGDFQGIQALAIGAQAGRNFQGAGSIALGALAGVTNQGANGIIVSSKQTTALNDTTDGHIHISSSLGSIDYTTTDGWALKTGIVDSLKIDGTGISVNGGGLTVADGYFNSYGPNGNTTNVSIGQGALASADSDITNYGQNVGIGTNAGVSITTGNANLAIGASSLLYNVTGNNNTAVGQGSLLFSNASNNTCIGTSAGSGGIASNNTVIGKLTGTAGLINTVLIGAGDRERIKVTSDSLAVGNLSGQNSQGDNGIIINSTGAALDDTAAGHIHIASSLSSIDYTSVDGWRAGGQAMVVADIVAASSDFADFQAKVAALQNPPVTTNAFVSVWATTGVDETITIPCQNVGTFNAVVDWGDGTVETITTYNGFSHEYAAIDDYTISITGTFPNIFISYGTERLKIKKVLNLGTVGWTRLNNAFYGCNNLTEFTVGTTDVSAVNTMEYMLAFCNSLTSIDVSSLDTSSVTNMTSMFQTCSSLTSIVGVEDWAITGLNSTADLTNFLTGGSMTTAQYDNLLVKWQAQNVLSGLTPSFGASTYTGGSAAATAKATLGSADNWVIADGGIEPSAFESVWATTAINETITIPCLNVGTFNAVVDWGDGTVETITTYNGFSHVYATAGDHTISITGTFPNIRVGNAAVGLKLKKVLNLGTVGWTNFNSAFYGCPNLTEFTAGSTDTSAVVSLYQAFQGCTSLTSVNLVGFNTSNVDAMLNTFLNCNALTSMAGVEDFDITGLSNAAYLNNFLTGGRMTTAQYDNLLVKWEAQSEFPGMSPSFGASEYTGGGTAAAARAAMLTVGRYNAIYDGGIA